MAGKCPLSYHKLCRSLLPRLNPSVVHGPCVRHCSGGQQAVPIPLYEGRVGEPTTVKRARLMYQSRKRGMLENDLLLSGFAALNLSSMEEPQLSLYDMLINLPSNDWEIYYWATGVKETPQEFDNEIMTALKNYVRNEKKENRTRQPDLY